MKSTNPLHTALSILALLLAGAASPAGAQMGDLQVKIRQPAQALVVPSDQTSIEVLGGASIFGGVRKLDLLFVIDTSKSLRRTDPDDYRVAGAIDLVQSLPEWSDIHIGVVDFDRNAKLVSPLTGDRAAVVEALRGLDQKGSTDLAAGIRTALRGFAEGGRPGSSRVMLMFTDGKSDEDDARLAMAEARAQNVAVSTLLLGDDRKGAAILREIADGTGGGFVAVTDPSRLPEAFLNLRTTGVESVTLRVNDSEPLPARMLGGSFNAEVPLQAGENRIVATATSLDGRQREDAVTVTVRAPGCAELKVQALRDGKPALSVSRRAVEIVFDASGSMWGQLQGRAKIAIAKEILDDALEWLPPDLMLSLRAYGHQHGREQRDCADTELLVPLAGSGAADGAGRSQIRQAIAGLKPRGQTPLGFALEQIEADFGDFRGERAVVLVTDGIESCGGDAPAAARALQRAGRVPVHVIGFGLGGDADEDLTSLRAIAEASGGRFLTAGSAEELRAALSTTVGTPFDVWREGEAAPVASGALGSDEVIRLPAGDYLVRVDSAPPQELPVSLASEETLTLELRREGADLLHGSLRAPASYAACDAAPGPIPGEDALAAAPESAATTDSAPSRLPPAPPAAAIAGPAETARRGADTAPGSASDAPLARRKWGLEIADGSVEVWENLRPDRSEAWGVVVKHAALKDGSAMVWRGDDLALAKQVARAVRDTLYRLDPVRIGGASTP